MPAGLGELRVLHLRELEVGRRRSGSRRRTGPPRSNTQNQRPKAITLVLQIVTPPCSSSSPPFVLAPRRSAAISATSATRCRSRRGRTGRARPRAAARTARAGAAATTSASDANRIASGTISTSQTHHGSRHSVQSCCRLTSGDPDLHDDHDEDRGRRLPARLDFRLVQVRSAHARLSGPDRGIMNDKTCGIADDAFPSPPEYGRSLPGFCANLLVRDVARSLPFYRDCLGAVVRYVDDEFAALVLGGTPLMLHRDSTYETHPWHGELAAGTPARPRCGAAAVRRRPGPAGGTAEAAGGTIVADAADKPHGWREAFLADPDGYVWAVGHAHLSGPDLCDARRTPGSGLDRCRRNVSGRSVGGRRVWSPGAALLPPARRRGPARTTGPRRRRRSLRRALPAPLGGRLPRRLLVCTTPRRPRTSRRRRSWPRSARSTAFDRRRPLRPWLHRIVVNRAIDCVARAALRARGRSSTRSPEPVAPPRGPRPARRSAPRSRGLPPEQRAVVVLRYVLELTPGEIAELARPAARHRQLAAAARPRRARRRLEEPS